MCNQLQLREVCLRIVKCGFYLGCKVVAINRCRSLPQPPPIQDRALPGEMNSGGTAIEMMNMIMNGCNIAGVEDALMEKRWLCVQCKVTLVCVMEQVLVVAYSAQWCGTTEACGTRG